MKQNRIPENEYKTIIEKMPICCVDVVVHHKNKVLLIKRNKDAAKGKWWLSGGRILKNEKMEHAAVRKTFEETGLKVKIEKKIGVYETMFKKGPFDSLKTGVHTVNVCFLATPLEKNSKIKIDETHSNFKWITKIDKNLHPYPKRVIKDSGVFG